MEVTQAVPCNRPRLNWYKYTNGGVETTKGRNSDSESLQQTDEAMLTFYTNFLPDNKLNKYNSTYIRWQNGHVGNDSDSAPYEKRYHMLTGTYR